MNLIKRLSLHLQVEYWRNVCASLDRELAQRDSEIELLRADTKRLNLAAVGRELRHKNECDALRAKVSDLKAQNSALQHLQSRLNDQMALNTELCVRLNGQPRGVDGRFV